MNKLFFPCAALLLAACGSAPETAKTVTPKAAPRARITQFYSSPRTIARGTSGNLCYGVESARSVTLDPPVEEVWPSQMHCVAITPAKATRYTLTAYGENGQTDAQTVEVGTVENLPEPKFTDVWVNSLQVVSGSQVRICVKTQNATSVVAAPGNYYKDSGCLTDYPTATTTYKLTAVGSGGQKDLRSVTVKVK